MIKVAAHFLMNHVEPLIDKLSDALWFIDQKGIPINEKSIRKAFNKLIESQLEIEFIRGIFNLAIVIIICLTVYMIIR